MAVRFWLHAYDIETLRKYEPSAQTEHYAGEGNDELVTAEIQRTGLLSHLKLSLVLGKVRFWQSRDSEDRPPFVRIDNHRAYPDGLALCPEDWTEVQFHRNSRTIDKLTALHRVQLLSAPGNDFVRRVFATYGTEAFVCRPSDFEEHLLVYCDTRHLLDGRVMNGRELKQQIPQVSEI